MCPGPARAGLTSTPPSAHPEQVEQSDSLLFATSPSQAPPQGERSLSRQPSSLQGGRLATAFPWKAGGKGFKGKHQLEAVPEAPQLTTSNLQVTHLEALSHLCPDLWALHLPLCTPSTHASLPSFHQLPSSPAQGPESGLDRSRAC